jgi:hypothetical protein
MKITFNIEADSAEEFAQALSVIRGERAPSEVTDLLSTCVAAVNSPEYSTESTSVSAAGMDFAKDSSSDVTVLTKVENGVQQVITIHPNTAPVESEKEKKTRRTKAQIEADKAAAVATDNTPLITEQMLVKGDGVISAAELRAAELRAAVGLPPIEQPIVIPPSTLITLDSLRELCFPVNKAGGEAKEGIKKWLSSNNYTTFSLIPEERYAEFKQFVEGLAAKHNIQLTTV